MSLVEREAGGIFYLAPPVEGVVFTTRMGGISPPPYESLNLGYLTGDRFENVAANRRLVSEMLSIPAEWVTGRQVHGAEVLAGGVRDASGPPPRPVADAVVTAEPDLPVAIVAADCVPIALIGRERVGAVHAGWRGMNAGVISRAVAAVGESPTAWIGPSIGPCHYAVGRDLIEGFEEAHPGAPEFSTSVDGSLRFDLRAAARWLLEKAGAGIGNLVDPVCTACDHRFYSYRREGTTGRQALVVYRPRREN